MVYSTLPDLKTMREVSNPFNGFPCHQNLYHQICSNYHQISINFIFHIINYHQVHHFPSHFITYQKSGNSSSFRYLPSSHFQLAQLSWRCNPNAAYYEAMVYQVGFHQWLLDSNGGFCWMCVSWWLYQLYHIFLGGWRLNMFFFTIPWGSPEKRLIVDDPGWRIPPAASPESSNSGWTEVPAAWVFVMWTLVLINTKHYVGKNYGLW